MGSIGLSMGGNEKSTSLSHMLCMGDPTLGASIRNFVSAVLESMIEVSGLIRENMIECPAGHHWINITKLFGGNFFKHTIQNTSIEIGNFINVIKYECSSLNE